MANTYTNKMLSLTVAILSHNHKETVARAIESVLSQQTHYSYELLLFDDASTDETQDILKSYHQKEPEKIRLFLFEKSEGPVLRAKQIYENSKGKYLTWLDADDYWVYREKIQKQLDFLEQHPEYAGCFHDAEIVSAINEHDDKARQQSLQKYKFYSQFNHYEPDFYPFHLIQRSIIPTASLVFRLQNFDDFFKHYHFPPYSFSWAFQLYIIRNSKFYYINEPWSVYYDHSGGISKKIPRIEFILNNIRILKWYKKDSYYKILKQKLYQQIASEYETLAYGLNHHFVKYGFLQVCMQCKALFWSFTWYFLRILKK